MANMKWYQDPKTTRRVVHHIAKRLHQGRSQEEIQKETKMPPCVIETVARSPLAPRPPDDPVSKIFEKRHSAPIFTPQIVKVSPLHRPDPSSWPVDQIRKP